LLRLCGGARALAAKTRGSPPLQVLAEGNHSAGPPIKRDSGGVKNHFHF